MNDTAFTPPPGAQAVYDFWLSLIPQFMSQFGAAAGARPQAPPAMAAMPWMNGLMFPADQIAKAAQMTQQSLQGMAQAMAPMMGAGAMPDLFAQWASAMPAMAGAMSGAQGAMPSAPSLASMGQAWSEFAGRAGLPTQAELGTAFDRTYGALSDALGLGPTRQLAAAWQDLVKGSLAQQEARGGYALVVNGAFVEGYRRLIARLADKATAGERVDSVLALIRLWAVCTEEAVHETLQSERGLAATAALTRASLAYRKSVQRVADSLSDMLDLATRRDLDEAFREIQALKRELRSARREGGSK